MDYCQTQTIEDLPEVSFVIFVTKGISAIDPDHPTFFVNWEDPTASKAEATVAAPTTCPSRRHLDIGFVDKLSFISDPHL